MIDINMKAHFLTISLMEQVNTYHDLQNMNLQDNFLKDFLKVYILLLQDYPNEFRVYFTTNVKN